MENRHDDHAPLIHVGRQGIYDRNGDVVAYELLFRDAVDATRATRRSADATGRVIVAAFTEFGLPQLVDTRACFINVTREFLIGELPIPFDSNQAVLEIVETVDVDDTVVAGVTALVARGFTIALDDFRPGTHDRLLDLATYVKIDVLDADPTHTTTLINHIHHQYPHIQLIAERLETEDDLHHAIAAGFDYFQGHVLGRPHVVSTTALNPARINRLRLLSALSATEVDLDAVVEHIAGDPALTYRLLQATNSAASGLAVRVSSVREAAVLLGLTTVRQWVTLMLLSDLTEASDDQLAKIMTRARLCATTAEHTHQPPDTAFSIGLLSGVADLLGRPTADLAHELPLSPDVTQALTTGTGPLGHLLTAVRDYENGNPTPLTTLLHPHDPTTTYLNALHWTTTVITATQQPTTPKPLTVHT